MVFPSPAPPSNDPDAAVAGHEALRVPDSEDVVGAALYAIGERRFAW